MARSLVYQLLLAGLIFGFGWASVAHGAAFRATRRQGYRNRAIALLGLAIAYTIIAFVIAPPDFPLNVLPFMLPGLISLAGCFLTTPDQAMPEYGSPRDIMLFRPPLPAALSKAGLFVPAAPPRRTSSWVMLAMTIALLAGLVLLRLVDF